MLKGYCFSTAKAQNPAFQATVKLSDLGSASSALIAPPPVWQDEPVSS